MLPQFCLSLACLLAARPRMRRDDPGCRSIEVHAGEQEQGRAVKDRDDSSSTSNPQPAGSSPAGRATTPCRVARSTWAWNGRARTVLAQRASRLDSWPESGYSLARMRYEIVLAPEALEDLRGLSARNRSIVRDAIEIHLRYEPTRVSRSRIKRLRGTERPQYRLRIEDLRVFYDVTVGAVEILAIVWKSTAAEWLSRQGPES